MFGVGEDGARSAAALSAGCSGDGNDLLLIHMVPFRKTIDTSIIIARDS
jgi:hypothetical protein